MHNLSLKPPNLEKLPKIILVCLKKDVLIESLKFHKRDSISTSRSEEHGF